jgi:hypothetical protein
LDEIHPVGERLGPAKPRCLEIEEPTEAAERLKQALRRPHGAAQDREDLQVEVGDLGMAGGEEIVVLEASPCPVGLAGSRRQTIGDMQRHSRLEGVRDLRSQVDLEIDELHRLGICEEVGRAVPADERRLRQPRAGRIEEILLGSRGAVTP